MSRTLAECEVEVRAVTQWKYDNEELLEDMDEVTPVLNRLMTVMTDLKEHVDSPIDFVVGVRDKMLDEGVINDA